MKGMKGRFLKKLKSISAIHTLKQGLVLPVNSSDKFSNQNFQTPPVCKEQEQKSKELVPRNIGVSELIKDLKDEAMVGHKENLGPSIKSNDSLPANDNSEIPILSSESGSNNLGTTVPLSEVDALTEAKTCNSQLDHVAEIDISSFQWQDHNLGNLCNPKLPTAFEQTVMEYATSTHEAKENNEEYPCPPGGSESVILYTTSLRGIRKTFEDCNTIRFLLESFRVLFYERDVSMHLEFREELWRIMGSRVVPPRLFIKGRHIGGADKVVGLHEQGKLWKLLQGIPLTPSNRPCNGCAGVRFVLCFNCNGSRKVVTDEENDELYIRCPDCNENGLVKCAICC